MRIQKEERLHFNYEVEMKSLLLLLLIVVIIAGYYIETKAQYFTARHNNYLADSLIHVINPAARLFTIESDSIKITDITSLGKTDLKSFTLHQNNPDPCNLSTRVEYTLPSNGHVKLMVYGKMKNL